MNLLEHRLASLLSSLPKGVLNSPCGGNFKQRWVSDHGLKFCSIFSVPKQLLFFFDVASGECVLRNHHHKSSVGVFVVIIHAQTVVKNSPCLISEHLIVPPGCCCTLIVENSAKTVSCIPDTCIRSFLVGHYCYGVLDSLKNAIQHVRKP